MTRTWAWLGCGVLMLLGAGCELDAREPFDLDSIVVPAGECVSMVHEALELGGPVYAYVGDGPGRSGGWGLVALDGQLALVRQVDGPDEAATAPVLLSLLPEHADAVELRAGAVPGELWVLAQAGPTTLLRLQPELGELARNELLDNFPVEEPLACGAGHVRMLLLIAGRPYVLALPPCSDDATLVLALLELDPTTLDFLTNWRLEFDPCANQVDPSACALANAYTLWSLGPGHATAFAELERVQVGLTQVRALTASNPNAGTDFRSDVSMLDLRMSEGSPLVRLLTFREVWSSWPTSLGPVELTQDPFSMQLHVRNQLSALEAALLRLDTISDHYALVSGAPGQLPLEGHGRLVQLPNAGAMLDVHAGALRAVPLHDVESWPNWRTLTLFERDDLLAFEPAGVGQLLLRFEQAAPAVLRVACLE